MKKLFAIAIMAAAVLASKPVNAGTELHPEIYPQTAVVIDTNLATDTVTVETFSGLTYEFYGVEDWLYGDICSLIMSDSGTPDSVLDDEILKIRYSGYVENYISAELEAIEHLYE